jgi:hypothetical protein
LTPAEASLWKALKNSQLGGRKFRRQHSVGKYVLDFYCVEEWLAIELDGEVHRSEEARAYDIERTRFLRDEGIVVIRFENFWCLKSGNLFFNKSRVGTDGRRESLEGLARFAATSRINHPDRRSGGHPSYPGGELLK